MLELSRGFRKVLVENFQLGLFLLLSTSLLACMGFFSLYRLVIHDWLMAAFDSAITLLILALQVYAWRSRRMDVVGWSHPALVVLGARADGTIVDAGTFQFETQK